MFDVGRSMFDVLLFTITSLNVIDCCFLFDPIGDYKSRVHLRRLLDFLPHPIHPDIERLAGLIHVIQNFNGPGLIALIRADAFNARRKIREMGLKAIQHGLGKAFRSCIDQFEKEPELQVLAVILEIKNHRLLGVAFDPSDGVIHSLERLLAFGFR